MFVIAGISPKTSVIDQIPRRCPGCGLSQAHLKRTDHYFSLFFIPLIKVKEGTPVLVCDRCGWTSNRFDGHWKPGSDTESTVCKHCGQALERGFKYCPSCGRPV